MGCEQTSNCTAKDGIRKLKEKKDLIKDYFRKSKIRENYMRVRCSSIEIPGHVINQDCSFFLFNFEGFFDIEKGFYSTLNNILEMSAFFIENKYIIRTYEELEEKLNYCCSMMDTCIDDGLENFFNLFKDKKGSEKICGLVKSHFQKPHNWVKGARFLIVEGMKTYEKMEGKKIKEPERISNAINLLRKIIPYEDFIDLIDQSLKFIENIVYCAEGGYYIFKGIKNIFKDNKFEGALSIFQGILYIGKAGLSIHNDIKRIYNYKQEIKLNKSQENFQTLLNLMNEMVNNLDKTNYKDLYENNIIILAIDNENNTTNEKVELEFVNIDGIDYYAESLDKNDTDRLKFIKNMLIFYNRINAKISTYEKEQLKNIKKNRLFLLILRHFMMKYYNNRDKWINLSKEEIERIIDFFKSEFDDAEVESQNIDQAEQKIFKNMESKLNLSFNNETTNTPSETEKNNFTQIKDNLNNNNTNMNNIHNEYKKYPTNLRIKNNNNNKINHSYTISRYSRISDRYQGRRNYNQKEDSSPAPIISARYIKRNGKK